MRDERGQNQRAAGSVARSANFFLPSIAASSGPGPTAAARFEPRERLPPLPSPPLLLGSAAHLDVARKLPLVLLTRCDGDGGGRTWRTWLPLALSRCASWKRKATTTPNRILFVSPTPPRQRLCLDTSSFLAAAVAFTRKSASPCLASLIFIASYC